MSLILAKPAGQKLILKKDSVAATDTNIGEVSLLLHGNGANGSTTIIDSSLNPKTVTAVGDAKISTAQSKFGGSSIAFDGTGDYLTVPPSADFNFGTGDFTVEGWVNVSVLSGTDFFIASASGNGGFFFGYKTGIAPVGWGVGRAVVAWDYVSGVTTSTNQWQHIAVSRQGTTLRLFANGLQIGSITNSASYNISTTSLTIGSQGAAYYLNGYIDELRITKGVARYTANFTPPTAPFPDF